MTVLGSGVSRGLDAWQRLGFAVAYPWFKVYEIGASNHEYRGDGEFIDIERHDHTDYERGVITGLLTTLPMLVYLSAICLLAMFEAPSWAILAVALCTSPSTALVGEVTVRTRAY